MSLKDLLSRLAKDLKVPKLELSDQGRCNVEVNGVHLVSIEPSLRQGEFIVYSVVGLVADEQERLIFRLALEGNLFQKETGGAALGYHPETRSLVLAERFQGHRISEHEFVERFALFIQYLEYWKRQLSPEHLAEKPLADLRKHAESLSATHMKIFFA